MLDYYAATDTGRPLIIYDAPATFSALNEVTLFARSVWTCASP